MEKIILSDRVVKAANRVWAAFLKFGPVDDGRPEGDEFDTALMELRLVSKASQRLAREERKALVEIVNILDHIPKKEFQTIPGRLVAAIHSAKKVIAESDILVEAIDTPEAE